jgi:uncharacterized protein YndB with AHSA1/START domain
MERKEQPVPPISSPELSGRPYDLSVAREMAAPPGVLYEAWTTGFDTWFAAPGTVLMQGAVDAVFFFETHFDGERHPHYGRFLALDPDRHLEMTWLTTSTLGAETVVTVDFEPSGAGTLLRLTHAGFPDEALRDRHADAWPRVLAHLDEQFDPATGSATTGRA